MRSPKWLWLGLCFIIYFLFLRPVLLTQSLSFDEILTSNICHLDWKTFFGVLQSDTQLPLYFVLQKIWGMLPFPDNDYFLKLPSLIYVVLALFLGLEYFHRKSSGEPLAVITYSALFLFSPIIISSGLFARPYALFFLGCMWLLVRICNAKGNLEELLNWKTGGAIGLVLFSHPLGVLFFAATFVAWFAIFKPKFNLHLFGRRMTQVIVLEVVAALIWDLSKLASVRLIQWTNATEVYNLGNSLLSIFSIPAWAAVAVILGLSWNRSDKNSRFLQFSLLIQFTLFVGFSLVNSLYVPRYWIGFLPLIIFLLTEHLMQLKANKWSLVLLILIVTQEAAHPPPIYWGYKQAFNLLKSKHPVESSEAWTCVTSDETTYFLPKIYMRMYWGRDLCAETLGIQEFIDTKRRHKEKLVLIDIDGIPATQLQKYSKAWPNRDYVYSDSVFSLEK